MRENFLHKIRIRFMVYGILSILLAFLTGILFFYAIRFVYKTESLSESRQAEYQSNYTVIMGKLPETHEVKEDSFEQGTNTVMVIMSLIVMLLSYVCYFLLFTRKYDQYMNEIKDGVAELSSGNFNLFIPQHEESELSDIARNLNRMARQVKVLREEEQTIEGKKNTLITNVAHDLRTPVTSIIGYLELAKQEEVSKENRTHYIRVAYEKSLRLEKLISDLFTYTKLEFGEVSLHTTKVDIIKLLEQLLEEFYPSFYEAKLEYRFSANVKSAVILGDGDLLARVFENLISNAIRYGANGKNINVNVHVSFGQLKVQVINFGEMIQKKDLELIFDKFYRVDSSRNEQKGGTGLGLSIAQNIVKMHHGTIQASSGVEGTIFEVILDGCTSTE